jgi:hypothetical protein
MLALSAVMLVALIVGGAEEEKRSAESIAKAEKAVKDHLADRKAAGAGVAYLKAKSVESALPNYYLFAVRFPQFPVGRVPPKGLKPSNLFAVGGDGKVTVLTDAKELERFYRDHLTAAKEEAAKKTALRGWLSLTQHFHQDGFFTFAIMDDTIKVDGKTAGGSIVVMKGGSGTLRAQLTFDDAGKLDAVKEESKIRRGPRPICQATKLLDADPLVRRMAEEDLLIMGTAAKEYLDEQRAKAHPDLRRAIDRLWQRILESER